MYQKQGNARKVAPQDYYNQDTSQASIAYGSPQRHANISPQMVYENEDGALAYKMQKQEMKRAKKEGLDHLYKQNYQPARFAKALQFRNDRSYMRKLPSGHYKELDTFENTQELKQFGLGTYFYVQFFRRLVWLFLVLTLVQGVTIYMNWLGSGMKNYSTGFSTYLIKTTIANFTGNVLTGYDTWVVSIAPAVSYLALMLFYFIWKAHYFRMIALVEEDNSEVRPQKFCLEIAGMEEGYVNEQELKTFFSAFGPVYEVSLVRRHKNKLSYFEELDELEEQIREEELEIVLGSGDKGDLNALKKEKEKLNRYINSLQIYPKTISVFVHFQYQKSKVDCLTYFNRHYMFDTCGHECMRVTCCCCVDQPDAKYLFHGQKLLIKSERVPAPEDINWGSFELSAGSKLFRVLFSFFIIVVFLAVSCTVIGLCSIYINSHAGTCDGVTLPGTALQANATANATLIQCYCTANLVSSYSDATTSSVCENYRTNIMITQGIQYGVIVTSAITNFLFGLIVDKLVNFVRPESRSAGLLIKTTIYTIFIILNSVFIPVLIYADIFGFIPSNYVSFLTIISTDVKAFFSVSSLTFIPTFNTEWYNNVSVVFVNFLVVDIVLTWVFFVVERCGAGYGGLEGEEGKILQKSMNEQITSYKLNVYKQASQLYLVLFMVGMFWAGIPALVPLGLIDIFSRYATNRMLLQGSSSKIQGLGQDFMSLTLTLLPVMLIFFPVLGEWMLVTNSSIYPSALSMTFPYFTGLVWQLDWQLYLPFYLIISLVAVVQFFFYNTLVRCFGWLSGLCYERKEVVHAQHTRPFAEYAKGMNVLCSFNIRNNDEMRNAVLNLQKYLVEKEMD